MALIPEPYKCCVSEVLVISRYSLIDTYVLPEEKSTTEEESPHNLLVVGYGLEWLPETEADSRLLMLNCIVDSRNLLLHVDVINGKISHPSKILERKLTSSLGK